MNNELNKPAAYCVQTVEILNVLRVQQRSMCVMLLDGWLDTVNQFLINAREGIAGLRVNHKDEYLQISTGNAERSSSCKGTNYTTTRIVFDSQPGILSIWYSIRFSLYFLLDPACQKYCHSYIYIYIYLFLEAFVPTIYVYIGYICFSTSYH